MPRSLALRRLVVAVTLAAAVPVGAESFTVQQNASACTQPLQGDACVVLNCADCAGAISGGAKTLTMDVTDGALAAAGFAECTIHDLNTTVVYTHADIGDTSSELRRNGNGRSLWSNASCESSVFYATLDDEAAAAPNTCPQVSSFAMRPEASLDDFDNEGLDASWQLVLENAQGSGTFQGWSLAADVSCLVRPEPGSGCTPDAHTACLNSDRFSVRTTFRTGQNATGSGGAAELTSDTGWFWFFNPTNAEVFVKVIDGCGVNNNFWVFASGLTDVEVVITVRDRILGTEHQYTNPLGTAFQPIQRTSDFPCS